MFPAQIYLLGAGCSSRGDGYEAFFWGSGGQLSGSRVPAQGLCEGNSEKISLLRDADAQWRDEGVNPGRTLIDAQESPSTMMLCLIL